MLKLRVTFKENTFPEEDAKDSLYKVDFKLNDKCNKGKAILLVGDLNKDKYTQNWIGAYNYKVKFLENVSIKAPTSENKDGVPKLKLNFIDCYEW